MKNSLAYILWIAFWNLWLENWTWLVFNFPGKCYVCSSSSCAKSYLTLASIFVHFIFHERSWANQRSGDLLYNWHLRFWCPTSIFLPRKTMLLYLFREVTLVWLSVTQKADQSEDSTGLTTVINSGIDTWAQSFFSTTQCFSKRDILFLHVLPVCVYVSISFHFTFLYGERQLENKTIRETIAPIKSWSHSWSSCNQPWLKPSRLIPDSAMRLIPLSLSSLLFIYLFIHFWLCWVSLLRVGFL